MSNKKNQQWCIICPEEGKIQVKQIPIPVPASGEVLVKCQAAPINPSDLGFLKGYYSEHQIFDIHYPSVAGWEGAGEVIQNGGGLLGWRLVGKRVAFTRKLHNDTEMVHNGCYSQYVIANALECLPLPDNVPTDVGSMHFVNPLTAIGLVEKIIKYGGSKPAAVQTAACGQLGRMITKLCEKEGIPLINVVRREEQVRILTEEYGQKYVLNQTDADFKDKLKALSKELGVQVMLECIGGKFTAELLACLPEKSTCMLYGSLDEVGLEGFNPSHLIGRSYAIEGFVLGGYLKSKGLLGILPVITKAVNLMNDSTLQSKIQKRLKFSEFKSGLEQYYKNMSAGKYVLCPFEEDPDLEKAATQEVFEIGHLNSN